MKKNISMSDYHLALITEFLKQYSESRKYNSGILFFSISYAFQGKTFFSAVQK